MLPSPFPLLARQPPPEIPGEGKGLRQLMLRYLSRNNLQLQLHRNPLQLVRPVDGPRDLQVLDWMTRTSDETYRGYEATLPHKYSAAPSCLHHVPSATCIPAADHPIDKPCQVQLQLWDPLCAPWCAQLGAVSLQHGKVQLTGQCDQAQAE